jgi:hypothetical protein
MIDPENECTRRNIDYISIDTSSFCIRCAFVNFEHDTKEERKENSRLNELIEKIRFCLLLVVKRGNISHEIDMYTSTHHEQTLPRASIYCVCMLQLFIQM